MTIFAFVMGLLIGGVFVGAVVADIFYSKVRHMESMKIQNAEMALEWMNKYHAYVRDIEKRAGYILRAHGVEL